MTNNAKKSVIICMGSSCFSRGNKRNIEVITQYLERHEDIGSIEFKGRLCEGQCSTGPNLHIDGVDYHGIDPVMVADLLHKHLTPLRP
jgi:NADH:ubiquinone oxidoreductase subunit E